MITTVTLNASIDKAYHMQEEIVNGTVMRVASTRNSAGGKGLNVARVVKLCGEEVQATGLVGGYNGDYLKALLDADGISHDFGQIKGETRSCINVLDPGFGSTEYLESGCEVTEDEENAFMDHFCGLVNRSDVIAISGSAPKGVREDVYRRMISIAKRMEKQVILDTSGDLLKEGIKAKPTMVKPNKDEIELLFDTKIESREDVIQYGKMIYEQGIPYVVISLGGEGALLVCEEGIFQGKPPKMEVVNTVGCGDSMVGAFAVAMERKYEAKEALRYGVAVATANAMSPNTGNFDPKVMEELLKEIQIIQVEKGELQCH